MRAALGVALVLAAALLACVGLCLGLWGMFMNLSVHLGASGAALFIAVLTLLLAGMLAWTATQLAR